MALFLGQTVVSHIVYLSLVAAHSSALLVDADRGPNAIELQCEAWNDIK
jgi:hypothetical protein